MSGAFFTDSNWVQNLPIRIKRLPFDGGWAIYESLRKTLGNRTDEQIANTAAFMLDLLQEKNSEKSLSEAASNDSLNVMSVLAHFDPPSAPSPLVDACLVDYIALAGLIKVQEGIGVAENELGSLASLAKAADCLIEANTFDSWASCHVELLPLLDSNSKLGKRTLALEARINELRGALRTNVRMMAKRKLKKAKSAAAKKGHAVHTSHKEQAIALFVAGKYPSVLKAADEIAPKVHVTAKTVQNWLYDHNKQKQITK